jgi:putative transposase
MPKRVMTQIIYEVAERYDFEIDELVVMSDHVHLFVSTTPTLAPAKLIQIVKSITAREAFKRFPSVSRLL